MYVRCISVIVYSVFFCNERSICDHYNTMMCTPAVEWCRCCGFIIHLMWEMRLFRDCGYPHIRARNNVATPHSSAGDVVEGHASNVEVPC